MKKLQSQLMLASLSLALLSCSGNQEKTGEAQMDNTVEKEEVNVEMVGKTLNYSTDTVQMQGYIAYQEGAGKKMPGVLVVHEWWGHNDYSRKRADMLAELGYVALAVDMYGNGKTAQHPQDAMKFSSAVMQNFDAAKARFESALEQLKSHPAVDSSQIAAIGYCFGGSVVLSMANAGYDLDAVAAFHAGLQLPVWPEEGAVKGKVVVMNGSADPMVTADHVANFKKEMDEAGAQYEYIAYEGAKHAYTSKAADSLGAKFDIPLAYNAEADEQSWERMKELLDNAFEQ